MTNDTKTSAALQNGDGKRPNLQSVLLMPPPSPGYTKRPQNLHFQANGMLARGIPEPQFASDKRPTLPSGYYADSGVGEPLSGPDSDRSSEFRGEPNSTGDEDRAGERAMTRAEFEVQAPPPNSAKIPLRPMQPEFDFGSVAAVKASAKANAHQDILDLFEKIRQLSYTPDDAFAEAVVTWSDALNSVWMWFCQEGHVEDFGQIMGEIQNKLDQLVDGSRPVSSLNKGQIVLVPHDVTGYCRGVVLSPASSETAQGPMAEILFPDYGATRLVEYRKIHEILPEYAQIVHAEPVSTRCKMREINYGFRPFDLDHFESEFTRILASIPLRCVPVLGGRDFVDVTLEYGSLNKDVGKKLDKLGFGLPRVSLPPRTGRFAISKGIQKWKLANVLNPAKFSMWPEFTRVTQFVNAMSYDMKKAYDAEESDVVDSEGRSYLDFTIPETDAMVGVLYDGKWLRGRVVSVEFTAHCMVYLVDFGVVGRFGFDEVRPLVESCMNFPALALECVDVEIYGRPDAFTDLSLNVAMPLIESCKDRECIVDVKKFVRVSDVVDNEWVKHDYVKVILYLPDTRKSLNAQLNENLSKM